MTPSPNQIKKMLWICERLADPSYRVKPIRQDAQMVMASLGDAEAMRQLIKAGYTEYESRLAEIEAVEA